MTRMPPRRRIADLPCSTTRVAVLAFAFAAACGSAEGQPDGPPKEAGASSSPGKARDTTRATRVEVAELVGSAAVLELTLPGEIEGGRDALLSAPLGGFVESVRVTDGQRVNRGQTLVRVDAAIRAVELEQARIERRDAERQLARAERLGQAMAAAEREARETQLARAKATERLQQLQLRRAIIRAPFDGVVVRVEVEEGETAPPGEPLLRLVQLDPLSVSVSVSDRDVVALSEGVEGTVRTDARAGLRTATLSSIEPAADLDTRAFDVEFSMPNPDGTVLPGMIAQVTVRRALDGDRVVIPQDFVVTRLEELGVFLDDDGVARWQPVTLGRIVRDQVVVEDGLSPGDVVVVVGHRDLADGDELLVSRRGACCEAGRVLYDEGALRAAVEPVNDDGEEDDEVTE